ncbi:MAG: hypothetical protein IOD12_16380 [Silvanigrellales bacterium]|nr:hypothetical protein [Silvanigrellales bacterium]
MAKVQTRGCTIGIMLPLGISCSKKSSKEVSETIDPSGPNPSSSATPIPTPANPVPEPTTTSIDDGPYFGVVTKCITGIEPDTVDQIPQDTAWYVLKTCSPILRAQNIKEIVKLVDEWRAENCAVEVKFEGTFLSVPNRCQYKSRELAVRWWSNVEASVTNYLNYTRGTLGCERELIPEEAVTCALR